MSEAESIIRERVLIVGVTDDGVQLAIKVDAQANGDGGVAPGPGALAVNLQDQYTLAVLSRVHTVVQSGLSFASTPSVGSWTVTLSTGHGFTAAGEQILIEEGSWAQYLNVTAIAGDVLTLAAMVTYPFTTGADVSRVDDEMAVNGLVTRQVFVAYPPPDVDHDITGIRISIICATEPDDSLFGDLAALVRGMNVHALLASGAPVNLGTFFKNGDLSLIAGDVEYTTKAGGGSFSVRATAYLKNHWGVTVRVHGTVVGGVYSHDEIRFVIQDNLTGLDSVRAVLFGHAVQ